MAKANITGKVVKIFPTVVSQSGYKTRKFWVEETSEGKDGRQYTNICEFELGSAAQSKFDNTAELDNFGVGTVVSFDFSPRGSKPWTNPRKPEDPPRVFMSLRVVSKINVVGRAASPSPSSRPIPTPAAPSAPVSYDSVGDDDMPF